MDKRLGLKPAPRSKSSSMETAILKRDEVEKWEIPAFQRGLRINAKVKEMADELRNGGYALEGVLTLGRLKGSSVTYIVDGQHRIEGFKLSGLSEVIADIRLIQFDSMAEMAEEFVRLNSSLVRMKPDDILRGMEASIPAISRIRAECKFVGYDNLRRKTSNTYLLGMSAALRCWEGSKRETPTVGGLGSAQALAEELDGDSTQHLIEFLHTAYAAWGHDPENYRLWGNLNLIMCMWLYRMLVLDKSRQANRRYVRLSVVQYRSCLMALSADATYIEWLLGRQMRDRDRNPCYQRVKAIFTRRVMAEGGAKPKFPQPGWSTSS